jgi:hypothetical protein
MVDARTEAYAGVYVSKERLEVCLWDSPARAVLPTFR